MSEDTTKRRIGKFYIIDRGVYGDEASEIFTQLRFVPLRVEHLAYKDEFEFIGYSYQFEAIEFGLKIPEYNIEITADEDNIIVRAIKI